MKITLKDGSVKEYAQPMAVIDIAKDLSEGLARVACAGEVDGEVVDLRTVVDRDAKVNILTASDEGGLSTLRHTASHVMAQAIKRLYPNTKLAIGPSIADGFYYDDFLAPDKAETFVGQLVSTQWWQKGGRFALICNFLAEDGRKIALFAFQKYTGFYGPGDGAVNFKHAEMNTFWECEVRENRKGRCTWASALQLGGPKNNAI